MATWQKPLLVLVFMFFTLQTHDLSLPVGIIPKTASNEIHDLVQKYGLPRGLIPNIVKSYTISEDGHFQIFLEHPCYVQFDKLVYYDNVLKGKLKYGSATDVSGIQVNVLFVWVSVTGIEADSESDMVEFHAGVLSKKLPAEQFLEIPVCKNRVYTDRESTHPESM